MDAYKGAETEELKQKREELRLKIQELRAFSQELKLRNEATRLKEQELLSKEENLNKTKQELKFQEQSLSEDSKKKQDELHRIEENLNEKAEKLKIQEEKLSSEKDNLAVTEAELKRKEEKVRAMVSELKAKKGNLSLSAADADSYDEESSPVHSEMFADDLSDNDFDDSDDEYENEPSGRMNKMVSRAKRKFKQKDGLLKTQSLGVVLLSLGALFIAGFVLINILMSMIVGTGNVVIVPDLHNEHFDVARKKSMEMDLFVQQIEHQHHDEIAQNRIISQSPEPHVKTKTNRTIEVVVSLGPELIRVPHLDNITEREARLRLDNVGLRLGSVTPQYSNSVERGRVISSQPVAESLVARGSGININVSLGRMPDATDRHRRGRGVLDSIE